jgi:hypothetical protein
MGSKMEDEPAVSKLPGILDGWTREIRIGADQFLAKQRIISAEAANKVTLFVLISHIRSGAMVISALGWGEQ